MKKNIAGAALALASIAANAGSLYSMPDVFAGDGNQAYMFMIANTFTVNQPGWMVTHLGAFDDDMNGLSTNIAVGLLNMDAQTVVRSVVLNGASHGSGNGTHWQFAEIASAVLVAGTNYAIAAYGFNASNENYNAGLAGNVGLLNFNTLSGAVTNTGSYAYPGPSFNFVGTFFPAANAPRFGGGNAVLSPVPEASTLAMMAAGLGVAGFAARRRKADS